MKVQVAQPEDVGSWLGLAAEVEHLFGPMVSNPKFRSALMRNVERGSAFCIRESDGSAGAPLLAGVLFSAKPPAYKIGWMSVAQRQRRHGLGTILLAHVMSQVIPPAEVSVATFGSDVAEGAPARKFYLTAGFIPAEITDGGPEGGSRQIFRKAIE